MIDVTFPEPELKKEFNSKKLQEPTVVLNENLEEETRENVSIDSLKAEKFRLKYNLVSRKVEDIIVDQS